MNLVELRQIKTGTNKEVVSYIDQLCSETQKKNLKIQRGWYIFERFFRGDHWVVFNKTLNRVQTLPISDGEIRRTINKIRTQVRGIKNFIKRNQPRWEVQPDDSTDDAYEEARKKNKILQYYYRTLKFPFLLTDVIVSGLKFSVGILEGGIVKEGGKKKIKFWTDDVFDVLFDPFATNIQDCRYIIKVMKKPLSWVNANKDYEIKGKLTSDGVAEELNYRTLLNNEKYGGDFSSGSDDLEETTVKEIWIKWIDEGEVKIKVITISANQVIKVHEPKYRRYPFFIYSPEKEQNVIYADSWIKDLISINKSLDKGASQIESYIQRMLAGKYLIKQGVEVSSITDKGAEKIYYKGSVAPSQLNLQPLPAAPFSHTANCERWIEEAGGMREASLGRIPGSLQSGKAIEALQAADAQTVAEPIENLEFFLEEVAEFILELIADYQIHSETIVQDKESIKFIGEIEQEEVPSETVRITPSKVKVVIVPEVAYSQEEKFNRLIRMAEAGIVDPQTILEALHVSNVSDILERVEQKKQEEFKEEMMKQRESHRTDGTGPEDTADLADQENMQMASGQQVPMTPKALWTMEHTQLHMAFIQENQDAYMQQQQLFDEHIQNEEVYMQEGQQPEGQQIGGQQPGQF